LISLFSTTFAAYLPLPWMGTQETAVVVPLSPLVMVAAAFIIFLLAFAAYALKMSQKVNQLNLALNVTQLALAKEQRMATFGALAAAAAHELGSPLSTISLAAKDVLSTLSPDSPLREDAQLIVSQSERCGTILQDLSRSMNPDPEEPQQVLPLSALIELAAGPHKLPHIELIITKETPDPEPLFTVTPDILHGLGNVLQNAFQFATSKVRVTLQWDKDHIEAAVHDDGRGYPEEILHRLGEPKPHGNKESKVEGGRKGGHMGLGVYIAKTLLSQRQGEVHFSNDDGARCLIKWPGSIRVVNFEKKD
jgi:two-component system sensor histidine kinase RegB